MYRSFSYQSLMCARAHCAEDLGFDIPLLVLHFPHPLLGPFPFGVAVHRAAGFDDGEVFPPHSLADLLFLGQDQRTDHGEILPAEIGYRGETAQPPLIEQVHDKGLHGIVLVVAQCQLVAAQFLGGIVQRTPPHFGTQAAGIGLLSDIEHHPADVGALDDILDALLLKQLGNGGVITLHAAKAGVEGDGCHLIVDADEPPQPLQRQGKGNGILSAADTHCHPVSVLDHIVLCNGLAGQSHNSLHKWFSFASDFVYKKPAL